MRPSNTSLAIVPADLLLIAYAHQNTRKTGIVEIELWALDDSLAEVPIVRREQENDKALVIYDQIVDLSKKRAPDEEAGKRGSKARLTSPIPRSGMFWAWVSLLDVFERTLDRMVWSGQTI